MKILFLLKSKNAPSSRIRIKKLFPYLTEEGIDSSFTVIPKSGLQRLKLFKSCKNYDLVVLQKKLFGLLDLNILRFYAEKLIYDFDDAVYCKDAACSKNISDYKNSARFKKFSRTIKKCDAIIAANNILKNKAVSIVDRNKVTVINSPIPIELIKQKSSYTIPGNPIIGWVGTKSTQKYLKYITPALQIVNKTIPITLNVISNIKPTVENLKLNYIEWSSDTEYQNISNFDIGIMPLSNDPFSSGKAAYKLLQYMAAGIPSVCSNVGMNAELSAKDNICIGGNNHQEFADAIIKLIKSESSRKKLGERASKYVAKNFSYEIISKKYIDLFKKII
ncbi:MAG: glycosyltransferase family 4 protein [bacterium]|nr:glycosyltransferase family 4 protein [bacterium]